MKTLSLFVKILATLLPLALVIFLWQPTPATATAIFTSQAVQIPPELKAAINGAVLFAVMFGLQWVFDKLRIDLRGWGLAIAAQVAEFAILQMQGLIDLVPPQYDLWVSLGLYVLLAALTALGFVRAAFQRSRAAALFDW